MKTFCERHGVANYGGTLRVETVFLVLKGQTCLKNSLEGGDNVVKILPITEDEKKLLSKKRGKRSEVARPIIDAFLQSELDMGKIDLTTTDIPARSMILRLRHFVKRYEVPVRVTKRGDEIFLIREEDSDTPKLVE